MRRSESIRQKRKGALPPVNVGLGSWEARGDLSAVLKQAAPQVLWGLSDVLKQYF